MFRGVERSWAWPGELRRHGILGMNGRNASYLLPCNPRRCYPCVDDKLATKRICQRHGIPVPQTYGTIERQGAIRRFDELVAGRSDFVVKPVTGSEGRGIVVVVARHGQHLITAGQKILSLADLRYHIAAVLAGLYTLRGDPDRALVEQRIVPHPAFAQVSVDGTPDVRVVLYRAVPVMAMVRLPTRASHGCANLHQGAVGVGVQLVSGVTFGGACQGRAVRAHPDTEQPIAGIRVPWWPKLLQTAMTLADQLEMGYLGVDFVLDESQGPMVLEANARPGLAIQIANRAGLLPRLQMIDAEHGAIASHERRLELVARLAALRLA